MRVDPFALCLRSSLSTAAGEIDRREGFLVRVERGDEVGLGEATPLPGWTEGYEECEGALESVDDRDGDIDLDAPAARHGVELARADAAARAAGESLARYLGDDAAQAVAVNATIGDGSVEETRSAAREAVRDGYAALKVKVGARSVSADVARLRAIRAAVGDGVELRADANGAWGPAEAESFFAAAADAALDLAYVEQPLSPPSVAEHGALDSRGVDIALDESLAAVGPDAVLDSGVADVVVCKPMALGGPVRTLAFAERAAARGIDVVVTTTIDAVVARTAALHVAAAAPTQRACGLATGSLLSADLAADPAPVEDGEMRVPDGPGLAGDAFESLRRNGP
ncbi:mandelate racemase/muconate lactonizing enzyme family protein [Halobellus rubicundus]|uniref:o-succinylbenzoate synthase n=1 Tax=Halobellus rubicundus TaxID=2996466 RepID=A0ABD5MEJ0_9EURY